MSLRGSILPRFRRGDRVEVASLVAGFVGSYYEATVVADLDKEHYVVEYRTLVKDDFSAPLREVVWDVEVRPRPPVVAAPIEFKIDDIVDVWANDGWWVGRITGSDEDDEYSVFFDSTSEEIAYPKGLLRIQYHWINGEWFRG